MAARRKPPRSESPSSSSKPSKPSKPGTPKARGGSGSGGASKRQRAVDALFEEEDATVLGDLDDPFEAALRQVGQQRVPESEDPTLPTNPESPDPFTGKQQATDAYDPLGSQRGPRGAREAGPQVSPEAIFARLYVLEGPGQGGTIELPQQACLVLGRSGRCDVPLRDLSVSRRHAELRWKAGEPGLAQGGSPGFELRDLGSRNGCAVDNQRVVGWKPVRSGQTLAIGDLRLRLEYEAVHEDTSLRPSLPNSAGAPRSGARATRTPFATEPTPRPRSLRNPPSKQASSSSRSPRPPTREAAALLEQGTYRGGYPASRPTPPMPPLLKGAIALGAGLLIPALIWGLMSLLPGDSSSDAATEPPEAAGSSAASPPVATRLQAARDQIELEQWKEAQDLLLALRAQSPDDESVGALLALTRREAISQKELQKARRQYKRKRDAQAIRALLTIAKDSGYQSEAQDLMARINQRYAAPKLERARTLLALGQPEEALRKVLGPLLAAWPAHPGATKLREEARAKIEAKAGGGSAPSPGVPAALPPKPTHQASHTKPRGHRRSSARKHSPSASERKLLVKSRDLFAAGKASSALSLAETAADAKVPSARSLAKKISDYLSARRSADGARQVPRALGAYTDALFTAKEITPGGGKPAATIRKRLAQLHYLSGLKEQKAGHLGNARRNLNKALKYDPSHKQARALLGRL